MVLRLVQVNFKAGDDSAIGQGGVSWEVLADPEGNVFCILGRG